MAGTTDLLDQTQPYGYFPVDSLPEEVEVKGSTHGLAKAQVNGTGSYDADVHPSYTHELPGSDHIAWAHAIMGGVYANYLGDAPPAKIGDDELQFPINPDGSVFTGEEHRRGGPGVVPGFSRGPQQPYTAAPPSIPVIQAAMSSQASRGITSSADDLTSLVLAGDITQW